MVKRGAVKHYFFYKKRIHVIQFHNALYFWEGNDLLQNKQATTINQLFLVGYFIYFIAKLEVWSLKNVTRQN